MKSSNTRFVIACLGALLPVYTLAGVYKCVLPNGETVFQQTMCSSGKIDVVPGVEDWVGGASSRNSDLIEWNNATTEQRKQILRAREEQARLKEAADRELERVRKMSEEREKENQDAKFRKEREYILLLFRHCLSDEGARDPEPCDIYIYQAALKCLTPIEVSDLMGAPNREQSVGGTEYLYYSAQGHTLQLKIGYCGDRPGKGSGRVETVNVY